MTDPVMKSTSPISTSDRRGVSLERVGSPVNTEVLESIQGRILWLSTFMVHLANSGRGENLLKVGGHQASSASAVTIVTTLFFDFLRGGDQISIKPHASPAFYACQYLLGNLPETKLTMFRSLHGLQAYPSRMKDPDFVDFSTGSVGLGSVAPNYAALVERYISCHFGQERSSRFVSVLGDAELDEGSIWETVAEAALSNLGNVIWIIDTNRQSLDRIIPGIRVERFRRMFAGNGWSVIDAKYGRRLRLAFELPGGTYLRQLLDSMENASYQWLLKCNGAEIRKRLIAAEDRLEVLLGRYDDEELKELIGDLGGHDIECLRESLAEAEATETASVIFAYTIKGWGLPIAGDPQNHAALLTEEQMTNLRLDLGIQAGMELAAFPSGSPEALACKLSKERLARDSASKGKGKDSVIEVPMDCGIRYPDVISSQAVLSRLFAEISRSSPALADRMVTTSPDVATSTNLAGWLNRRRIFSPSPGDDPFLTQEGRALQWEEDPRGQHIELGISENNLFMLLGALGLAAEMYDEKLFPIGTLYDPFVCRGLDALIHALYSGAKFILVATPSGVSLSHEGGAHQSVITSSIALELPSLCYFQPCFAIETEWLFLEALRELTRDENELSFYLRLSTRPVDQTLLALPRSNSGKESLRQQVLSGAYKLRDRSGESGYFPEKNVVTVACSGSAIPGAVEASDILTEDGLFVNVVNVTSPGLLYRQYQASTNRALEAVEGGLRASQEWNHPAFEDLGPCAMVTVEDAHPHTLAWLSGALGVRGRSLGVDHFGQSGSIQQLYRYCRMDTGSIMQACVAMSDLNEK